MTPRALTERQRFERWAERVSYDVDRRGPVKDREEYLSWRTNEVWAAWQARASVGNKR